MSQNVCITSNPTKTIRKKKFKARHLTLDIKGIILHGHGIASVLWEIASMQTLASPSTIISRKCWACANSRVHRSAIVTDCRKLISRISQLGIDFALKDETLCICFRLYSVSRNLWWEFKFFQELLKLGVFNWLILWEFKNLGISQFQQFMGF